MYGKYCINVLQIKYCYIKYCTGKMYEKHCTGKCCAGICCTEKVVHKIFVQETMYRKGCTENRTGRLDRGLVYRKGCTEHCTEICCAEIVVHRILCYRLCT